MIQLFNDYVSKYDINNRKIKQKYTHTFRVQKLCEEIAKELNLSDEQIKLASLCGLFHDIGRFEQLKIYDSYNDYETIDHGDFGYEVFINEICPKLNISDKDKSIIAKSILYHNKFIVEDDITDEEKLFINITRDADKIDIFYVYINEDGYFKDGDGEISKKIREDFLNHKLVNRKDTTNIREYNIANLAFIWDINYDSSYRIIRKNKYFEQLEKVLNNSIYDEYFQVIKDFLKEK